MNGTCSKHTLAFDRLISFYSLTYDQYYWANNSGSVMPVLRPTQSNHITGIKVTDSTTDEVALSYSGTFLMKLVEDRFLIAGREFR